MQELIEHNARIPAGAIVRLAERWGRSPEPRVTCFQMRRERRVVRSAPRKRQRLTLGVRREPGGEQPVTTSADRIYPLLFGAGKCFVRMTTLRLRPLSPASGLPSPRAPGWRFRSDCQIQAGYRCEGRLAEATPAIQRVRF